MRRAHSDNTAPLSSFVIWLTMTALVAWAPSIRVMGAPPPGFVVDTIGGAFTEAVGIATLPDGRLLAWERGGRVWMMSANGERLPNPVLDIRDEVGAWRDFGLLGLAVDPAFPASPHIYLLYVVDRHHLRFAGTPQYDASTNEYFSATIGRVTRYTLDSSTGFTTTLAGSRSVLLGESMSTGIPILHQSHGVGSLLFGQDGTLLVSTGDSASYLEVDLGGQVWDGSVNQALADGILTQAEDVGAFRSQLVDSLCGKVLRIDPVTGDGLRSNPWYDPKSPRAAKSRVYSLGLRNPFRMTMAPNTGDHDPDAANPGTLLIGDVGWVTWEEVSVVAKPGLNLGWPIFEGMELNPSYASSALANPDAVVAGCQPLLFRDLLRQDSQHPARFIRGCAVLQAEAATALNAPVAANAYGFTGPGFRSAGTAPSGWIEWTVEVGRAGNHPLSFRYARASETPLSLEVLVDGRVVVPALALPSTGSTSDWREATTPAVTLAAGTRTIRIRFAGAEGLKLDAMWIEGVGAPDVPAGIPTFTHHRPAIDWQHPPAGTRTPGFASAGSARAVPVGSAGGATGSPFAGYCAIAGPILDFPSWPEPWRGGMMLADFVSTWLVVADVAKESRCGNSGSACRCGLRVTGVSEFDAGIPEIVGVFADTINESLYVVRWNAISRYRYLPNGSQPPTISLSADHTYGPAPLSVRFDASASVDPEGAPLTFTWNFGDGTVVDGGPIMMHVYTSRGAQGRTATVTARDPDGATASRSIRIGVNDEPPSAAIASLRDGQLYSMAGPTTLPLFADIDDANDGPDGLDCSWVTALHHDSHSHPEPPIESCDAETVISPIGCVPSATFWYEITLTVTDSSGLVATDTVALYPDCDGTLACAADIAPEEGDDVIDSADLGALLSSWGTAGAGDIDGNGTTDSADLGALLSGWGPCR